MTNSKFTRITLAIGILLLLTASYPVSNHQVKAQAFGTPESIQQIINGPDEVTVDSLLLTLRGLESINENYIRKSGWIYSLVERNNPFAENNPGTFYEGLTPKVSTHESWVLLLNDDGLLGGASFNRITDEKGQLVQIITRSGDRTRTHNDLGFSFSHGYSWFLGTYCCSKCTNFCVLSQFYEWVQYI